jgi:acetoin utilization protein AcuB
MAKDFSIIKVSEVMTKAPRSIEPHQSVETARAWMDELKIRHLPVRENGKVVGILSDRDLNLVLGSRSTAKTLTVEDAMISSVHSVGDHSCVSDVAREMLERRVGSVIVTGRDGGLLGIFTDSDALRVLAGC